MMSMPHNYKMIIAYDGTEYCGWQIQPNGITVQEVIQKNIVLILRHEITLIGSGRTDSGVHASGQVAHFHSEHPIDCYRFLGSLNGLLPLDIRIREVNEIPLHFHAQYSAIGKTYHYNIHLGNVLDPFKRLYNLHVRDKIDLQALKDAAALFKGTHDFTSFANEAHMGTASHDAVRTIRRLDIIELPSGLRLEFEADGFLYKMVRNITGTLLEVARGKRPIEDIPPILAAKDRKRAGQAAPPHGLFLMHVEYPSHLEYTPGWGNAMHPLK